MAKLALTLRNEKRRKTVEKFKAKRAQRFEVINDSRGCLPASGCRRSSSAQMVFTTVMFSRSALPPTL